MPQCLYLNKTECAVLATALNATKLSSYPEHQRGYLAKLTRRISGFLIDGQTSEDNQATPKKKLSPFARLRAEDEELKQLHADMYASATPHPTVAVAERPQLPVVLECEAAYATLRGRRKLND